MSAKAATFCALVVTVLGGCLARAGDLPASADLTATTLAAAQDRDPLYRSLEGIGTDTDAGVYGEQTPAQGDGQGQAQGQQPAPAGQVGMPGLSAWITYSRPDCCGPVGRDGPITYELFLRSGPVLTFGSGILGRLLDGKAGWEIQGGGRTLFFNAPMNAAWTVELALSNTYNSSKPSPNPIIVIQDPGNPSLGIPPGPLTPVAVTVRTVNRTFVSGGVGRQWYLAGTANSCGFRWRWGIDLGGRMGTGKATFAEIKHLTDTFYGPYGALYTDVERPCGCCTWLAGFRAEYDYIASDILRGSNNSDLQDVNLLVNFGVRF